ATTNFRYSDSEGTIAIKQTERLLLLEKDTGDGWTKVRRQPANDSASVDEGFVPTSYLQLTWY
uniref:SH3 domain-containing protein n=1 Tax=Romanomermis culicivorax TaxID=13658 RepID=A0A915IKG8_ROMCU